jgi:hypothetical protein
VLVGTVLIEVFAMLVPPKVLAAPALLDVIALRVLLLKVTAPLMLLRRISLLLEDILMTKYEDILLFGLRGRGRGGTPMTFSNGILNRIIELKNNA